MSKKIRKDNELLKAANETLARTEPKANQKRKRHTWRKLIGRRMRQFDKNHPWLTTVDVPSAVTLQQQDIANRTATYIDMTKSNDHERRAGAAFAVELFKSGEDQSTAIVAGFNYGKGLHSIMSS